MKIKDVVISDTLEKDDRNWRIEVFCELERGTDPMVRFHRQVTCQKNGKIWNTGNSNGERQYQIDRLLSIISADTVTLPAELGGITLSAAQIFKGLELLSNLYYEPEVASLTITTPPTTAAGSYLAPVVTVKDQAGLTISRGPDASRLITLSLKTGSGTLAGTLSMNAVNGVADFTGKGVFLNLVGSNKQITASTNGISVDTSMFTITPGSPYSLGFTQQPSSSSNAGNAFARQPKVTIYDQFGNVCTGATNDVTVSLNNGTGTLGGTKTKTAVSGVATFTDLSVDLVGSDKTLLATTTGPSLVSSVSDVFAITPASANQLLITTPPTTSVGAAFVPQPVVRIADQYGNTVTQMPDAGRTVTLSLQAGAGILGGTKSMSATDGVADFVGKGLNIDTVGADKVIRASATLSAGARTVDTNVFEIAV